MCLGACVLSWCVLENLKQIKEAVYGRLLLIYRMNKYSNQADVKSLVCEV